MNSEMGNGDSLVNGIHGELTKRILEWCCAPATDDIEN